MGGIGVDENARTSLPGLWAVGECASTGAHGANRLASNSLLEAIVFGARAATDITGRVQTTGAGASLAEPSEFSHPTQTPALAPLRRMMSLNIGLERNEADLLKAIDFIQRLEKAGAHDPDMRNMAAACLLIAGAALARLESRGGHFRTDYPATQPEWAHRTFIRLDDVRKRMDERTTADTRTAIQVAEHS